MVASLVASPNGRPTEAGPVPVALPPSPPATAIRTPDQRLRVFVSSTLQELAAERQSARAATERLRLAPVMFELGARPHPPRELYRAYLAQSDVFVGIYWQRYGWVAPGEAVSGLEDEYDLAGRRPKLIYVKAPAPEREERLTALLKRIQRDDQASYKPFQTAAELQELLENDLALLLTERFDEAARDATRPVTPAAPDAGRLPLPRFPLVDRARETAMLRELLVRDDVGLVTLIGPGGSGKTRLALHVAHALEANFADGARWVPLAPVRDPALVLPAIARALGVAESGDRPLLDTIKDALRPRQTLLLLDNVEQVVAAAPVVADLLMTCPRLKVLATSRTPLHLVEERTVPVPPLALPGRGEAPSAERLAAYAAVELFVQRARDARPDFALTDENAPVVAEICRRLDGLPLAIELAAARARVLPPRALLARLERRLPMLIGGARDLPVRQQTLRNTIAWSYDLLGSPEQLLFRRLAIFAGGCSLEAAEAVANPGGEIGADTLDTVAALVDQNLLRPLVGGDSEPRYGMLETIREYALERLEECGEAAAARRRHAEHFLALVEQAEPQLTSPERWGWLARLDEEHNNLRAALAWSLSAAGDVALGLRLAGALTWFWYPRGYVTEGRGWTEALLARPEAAPRVAPRAATLYAAAGMAWLQGDFTAARARAEESLAIARELGDRRLASRVLMVQGLVLISQGDPAAARGALQESVDTARAAGDRWWEALTLDFLGDATLLSGDLAAARLAYDAGLAAFEALGDRWGRGLLLHALGTVAEAAGDLATARSRYEAGLVLVRQSGDMRALAQALLALGDLALRLGDDETALAAFREALSRWRELGTPIGIGMCLLGLARVEAAHGQPERAVRLLAAAPGHFEITGASVRAVNPADVERLIADLRAPLTQSAFDAAWAAGAAMTLEQAIAYAVEEPPPAQRVVSTPASTRAATVSSPVAA